MEIMPAHLFIVFWFQRTHAHRQRNQSAYLPSPINDTTLGQRAAVAASRWQADQVRAAHQVEEEQERGLCLAVVTA